MGECSGKCGSCCGSCGGDKKSPLLDIKHKLFVLSGKGGVGKSTVAASLAILLAKAGKKVALLDVDFHGPSQPTIFGMKDIRLNGSELGIIPAEKYGVKVVSIGLLMENEDDAVIWRGPAKIGVLKQLLEEVDWGGDLDYLVLDFPPGTGDEVLSACQTIPGDKRAVMVTTPQEVSLADCRKCVDFCRQVEVPVAGVVENMSYFVCPNCNEKHEIFLNGGGAALAAANGVKVLARLPLDPKFLASCDAGKIADGIEANPVLKSELETAAAELIRTEQENPAPCCCN